MELNWPEVTPKQLSEAKTVKVIAVDTEQGTMKCHGSKGNIYKVSLHSCTCDAFNNRGSLCKHRRRLAIELNIINKHGRTAEQQREADIKELAYWYGSYHLFGTPVVSDKEYDELKNKVITEYGILPSR